MRFICAGLSQKMSHTLRYLITTRQTVKKVCKYFCKALKMAQRGKISPTVGNGLHCNSSCVFPVALLIELDDRATSVLLWGVKRVQAALMGTKLLHRARTKCVTSCDQHTETILNQPVGDLDQNRESGTEYVRKNCACCPNSRRRNI